MPILRQIDLLRVLKSDGCLGGVDRGNRCTADQSSQKFRHPAHFACESVLCGEPVVIHNKAAILDRLVTIAIGKRDIVHTQNDPSAARLLAVH